jgi:hypothetical protein
MQFCIDSVQYTVPLRHTNTVYIQYMCYIQIINFFLLGDLAKYDLSCNIGALNMHFLLSKALLRVHAIKPLRLNLHRHCVAPTFCCLR